MKVEIPNLFGLLKPPAAYFTVVYDDENIMHGEWNNWQCDDPACCCHEGQEAETLPIPVPWEALREREGGR